MSDLKASVVETKNGFHVEGYEKSKFACDSSMCFD